MYIGSKENFSTEIAKLAPNNKMSFVVADGQGNLQLTGKTVSQFATDIKNLNEEYKNDYIARDGTVTRNANTHADNGDAGVIAAYKKADSATLSSAGSDAQRRADKARNDANNNTNTYYVKKNTNYTVTADGAVLGRGSQDNWGERYVTWTGAKSVKRSNFVIK
jgi:hypothetical protein